MSKYFQAAQRAYDNMQPPEYYDEDDEQEDGVEELVEIVSEEEPLESKEQDCDMAIRIEALELEDVDSNIDK